jgi:integrase
MDGRLQVFRRPNSRYWQCATRVGGKQRKFSTKSDSFLTAKEVAQDWYLGLLGKSRAGLLTNEKTFRQVADQFEREYAVITEGQRSPRWVEGHKIRLRLHLCPFFGDDPISRVTSGRVQEYRVHRATTPTVGRLPTRKPKSGASVKDEAPAVPVVPAKFKAPSRSTLHDEVCTLRLVLKTAIRHEWLDHLPDLSPPYRTQGKIEHRPWFSPEEYKQLYEAARAYAKEPFHGHFKWNAQQVYDYILFMANTGLRPDEAGNLLHRDVTIVDDEDSGERILEIAVRGKRGTGFCKSMPGAVRPYERLRERARPMKDESRRQRQARQREGREAPPPPVLVYPKPQDPLFPGNHIKLFNGILDRVDLKLDREGKRRTAYSLRHTYICMRLMEGADIYVIAKNCRTSVEMVEKHYAAHIKDLLPAAAINVMRPKRKKPMRKPTSRPRAGVDESDD